MIPRRSKHTLPLSATLYITKKSGNLDITYTVPHVQIVADFGIGLCCRFLEFIKFVLGQFLADPNLFGGGKALVVCKQLTIVITNNL